MAWLKVSDTAAMYPRLIAIGVLPGADEHSVNECFGLFIRLATQAAAFGADYIIDAATAALLAGPRASELMRLLCASGLATALPDGVPELPIPHYRLINDGRFVHMRTAAEVEWDREQRNSTKSDIVMVPLLRRDGSACRWCGMVVYGEGRPSARTLTVDHLRRPAPGEKTTPDGAVIACFQCNTTRGGNTEAWDKTHELMPVPEVPIHTKWSAKRLTEAGFPTEPGRGVVPLPGIDEPVPPNPGVSRSVKTRFDGSGRDRDGTGSGRERAGTAPPAPPSNDATRKPPRRRGSRGGRSRKKGDA